MDDTPRDYIAENIHPFQVIAQQANMALKGGNPDYVHFMTYGWFGGGSWPTHHFRSLSSLCQGNPVRTYSYGDTGSSFDPDGAVVDGGVEIGRAHV